MGKCNYHQVQSGSRGPTSERILAITLHDTHRKLEDANARVLSCFRTRRLTKNMGKVPPQCNLYQEPRSFNLIKTDTFFPDPAIKSSRHVKRCSLLELIHFLIYSGGRNNRDNQNGLATLHNISQTTVATGLSLFGAFWLSDNIVSQSNFYHHAGETTSF